MDMMKQIKALLNEAEIYRAQGFTEEALVKFYSAADIVNKNKQIKNGPQLVGMIMAKIKSLKKPLSDDEAPPAGGKNTVAHLKNIMRMLHEAELYKTQGLLTNAATMYHNALDILKNSVSDKNTQVLVKTITNKLKNVNLAIKNLQSAPTAPELSDKNKQLIKKIFAFTSDGTQDSADLSSAIALAKFGQYETAISELNQLLSKNSVRLIAAKNILRCHIATKLPKNAVKQFHEWHSGDLFSPNQLEELHLLLETLLKKEGIESLLTDKAATRKEISKRNQEIEIIDISSISITVKEKGQKNRLIELDVNYQSGNIISFVISKKDRALIDNFVIGFQFDDIQFYSPIAIFKGAGLIYDKAEINSGPKKGYLSLDIKIISI